ncbi:hypothetical protein [Sphingomonas sp. 22176]|uniref:hypothetical protein n=1 Tax=Sphingomonas sp. 22176 TaxID=3453884 RepID=UPI003F848854
MEETTALSLDDKVSECVAVRDSGDVAGAAARLEAIVTANPEHFRATLELLVVSTTAGISNTPDRILERMPAELRGHPHIRLLIAQHHRQHGRLREAMGWLGGVSRDSVVGVPTFHRLRRDLLATLASYSAEVVAPFADTLPGPEMETARLSIAEAFLQTLVDDIDDPDDFFAHLQRWTFLVPDALHLRVDVFSRLVSRLPATTATKILSTAFAYTVATRQWTEAKALASRLLTRPESASDPVFVKSLLILSEDGDAAFKDVAARMMSEHCALVDRNAVVQDSNPRSAAKLNSIEVRARKLRCELQPKEAFAAIGSLAPTYSAQAAPGGMHLYVGLFGQVRFGKYLLSPLATYLKNELRSLVGDSGRLSFGIATWEGSGQRELQESDGYPFLQDLLPPPIAHALAPHRPLSVRDALPFIPNITRKLIDDCRETQVVDAAMLRQLFDGDAFVSIADDATYMDELGSRLAEVFSNSTPVLNQGRMWNRIAGHRALVEDAERHAGRPVTHALLIRSDLTEVVGPLGAHIHGQMLTGDSNWGLFDHDPHASYIEGVGDRYMVVDRAAFDRLMDGYELLRSIVTPETSVDPAYRVRLFPHTHLRTILFEHGTNVREILRSSVRFEIFRGRRTIAQLENEIRADADQSTAQEIRQILATLC